jgi:hypothetical protein
MDRRNFFRNLAIAAVSAPALVKVVSEAKAVQPLPPWFNGEAWHVGNLKYTRLEPSDVTHAFVQQSERIMQQMVKHIAETDPFASLLGQQLSRSEIDMLTSQPILYT